MITREEIEKTGWKIFGISANGGSLSLTKKEKYLLYFHGDNFIYKKKNDPRLTEIKLECIELVDDKITTTVLYKGHPKNIKELKKIIEELGIK